MRKEREVREEVLTGVGNYSEAKDNLKVKEVCLQGRRYIVCLNPEEAERETAEIEVIIESLRGHVFCSFLALVIMKELHM